MRIPEDFRKSVAYVYEYDEPLGTTFFVRVPTSAGDDSDVGVHGYAVTAKHLIEWRTREDPTIDIAVALLPRHRTPGFTPVSVGLHQIATDDLLSKRNIGPGDEVCFVGLLQGLPGKEMNRPVARFGHIARMNEERVPVKTGKIPDREDHDVILAEARSWPGYSGSPVFLVLTLTREPGQFRIDLLKGEELPSEEIFPLLGVVESFWELPEDSIHDRAPRRDPSDPLINVGITMIVPGQHIIDLLERDDLVDERRRREKEIENDPLPHVK